jgi:hypothetical protein
MSVLRAHVAGAQLRVPGGAEGLGSDLLSRTARGEDLRRVDPPKRVPAFAAGSWRRMSPLSRLVASAAAPLLEGRDDLETLPVVWGTALGELGPTERFLDRLFTEGPERASPLAFQNSVYNAPSGHLSIGLGLKGPSETVSAGACSGLAALARGLELIALGAPTVLVIAGDDITETWRRAFALHGSPPPLGEAVVALLLTASGPGPTVELLDGVHPIDGAPLLARATALPAEAPLPDLPGSIAPERCLGLTTCLGLVALVALLDRAHAVVGFDGSSSMTARVTP